MSLSDGVFNNLRQKLDALGYAQSLPLASIPLVGALLEDLIKSTESLRDAKKKIVELLEEKSCWELGVEPYKCDNSRLLSKCNQLHQLMIKEREDFEQRMCDFSQKIRTLQSDRLHLEEQCDDLQLQLKTMLAKRDQGEKSSDKINKESGVKVKKPFITTVRSGERLPPRKTLAEYTTNLRCTKCNDGYYHRPTAAIIGAAHISNTSSRIELEKLENKAKDLEEQVSFYMRKVEARDREIRRLNDLLAGGRPPAALAKDCCYKNVGMLAEDIELLQREKSECLIKIREYQDQMHEAMKRAMTLEGRNKQLQTELDTFKDAALQVEAEANLEIEQRERELDLLQTELKNMLNKCNKSAHSKTEKNSADDGSHSIDKRRINERLNELTQRESEMKLEHERLHKKIHKLKSKNASLQTEIQDGRRECHDEETIRLKSERDFFQQEYLRLVSKSGMEKEIEFLHTLVTSKDEELRALRSEMCLRERLVPGVSKSKTANAVNLLPSQPSTMRSENFDGSQGSSDDCVQAVVLRVERERDILKKELEQVQFERDTLREKHVCLTRMQAEETQKSQQRLDELIARIKQLERENRELSSARLPTETQIVLLKEEGNELKRCNYMLQEENCKLKMTYNQLKILHEQTEHTLVEYQNKLTLTEHKLGKADMHMSTLDSNRETLRNETTLLRSEVAALKKTYVTLENEKDKILSQLDVKTERAYKLEYELKSCQEKRDRLENEVHNLEDQLKIFHSKSNERDTELQETSTESKSLRHQISALKTSRDEAIAENGRLTNELAESQAEILTLRKKLKDSDVEIDRLKQQLHQYVQEVKKAEDLLMHKEKEREEMLEHYRSLSHDAVMLEGNNQSLEVEAAECKRQICELEAEIEASKKEIFCRNSVIEQLEDKVSALTLQNGCLERQLEEAIDEQRLLKVDLAARKQLCDKLDIQRDKLNAELNEVNEIRHKLEQDKEKLLWELDRNRNGNRASAETLEELLSKTRRDLEEQINIDSKLSQEVLRLRQQNDELLRDLDTERQKRQQHETLAQEYDIQNQELRHNLTEDRFRQARSREQSPRFPAQTM